MKKLILGCILAAPIVHAGFNGNTAHSRANCGGFNESITWNALASHWWEVHSLHYLSLHETYPDHIIKDLSRYTWRSAAYHAKEGYSSRGDEWYVIGYHFYVPNDNPNKYKKQLDRTTGATDCNIYDGWWDI